MKHYCPSSLALEEARASEVQLKIFSSILQEYGLEITDLASGTTDSGSDVKAMCVNGLGSVGVVWKWCVSHMASVACEHAFGTSADASKTKNKQAREILKLVIKVVETLNKSQNLKTKLEEIQLDLSGEVLKVTKHAPQRWLSLINTLERIIRLWHSLRTLYSNQGKPFPLDMDDNQQSILELYSLMKPIARIVRAAQYSKEPVNAEMHMAFSQLKLRVLDVTQPLEVRQHNSHPMFSRRTKPPIISTIPPASGSEIGLLWPHVCLCPRALMICSRAVLGDHCL